MESGVTKRKSGIWSLHYPLTVVLILIRPLAPDGIARTIQANNDLSSMSLVSEVFPGFAEFNVQPAVIGTSGKLIALGLHSGTPPELP